MAQKLPLYSLTAKQCQIRNITLAACNGVVSLVILLIAPLGLAAVITNTVLIVASTYGIGTLMDKILTWLHHSPNSAMMLLLPTLPSPKPPTR